MRLTGGQPKKLSNLLVVPRLWSGCQLILGWNRYLPVAHLPNRAGNGVFVASEQVVGLRLCKKSCNANKNLYLQRKVSKHFPQWYRWKMTSVSIRMGKMDKSENPVFIKVSRSSEIILIGLDWFSVQLLRKPLYKAYTLKIRKSWKVMYH